MITLAIFVTLRYLRGPDAWEKCFLPLPVGEGSGEGPFPQAVGTLTLTLSPGGERTSRTA